MTVFPDPWGPAREWLIFGAAALSAFFAGGIWWLAWRRFRPRYAIRAIGFGRTGNLLIGLLINNRGDRDIVIEAISVKAPYGIVVGDNGALVGAGYSDRHQTTAQKVSYHKPVRSDEVADSSFALRNANGFAGVKRVSIRLHILSNFPVMRQRTKTLTAILPAKIRMEIE
jgi:hypothetical protein